MSQDTCNVQYVLSMVYVDAKITFDRSGAIAHVFHRFGAESCEIKHEYSTPVKRPDFMQEARLIDIVADYFNTLKSHEDFSAATLTRLTHTLEEERDSLRAIVDTALTCLEEQRQGHNLWQKFVTAVDNYQDKYPPIGE